MEKYELWTFVSVLLTKVTACYYIGQKRIQKQIFCRIGIEVAPFGFFVLDPILSDLEILSKLEL